MRHTCEKMRNSGPRAPQKMSNKVVPDLRIFQVASKLCLRGPRGAQKAPKTPQERPKSIPRAAQSAPKPPKSARKAAQIDPRVTEICPRDAQCASRGTFFVLFFVFFCFVAFFIFFLGVCCIFLRLLYFSARLRVNVTRRRIFGGASNRGVGKG